MDLASSARSSLGRLLSTVVDPFIVGSFDRTGYRIHALSFEPGDLDVDLSGRRCLVTGANSGIGYATARALAERGATVSLLCRNAERGRRALLDLRRETGRSDIRLERVDMADLASVGAAGRRIAAQGGVDVLVHNAGVLPDARIETADGLELTFATHVAGPFLLTRLLEERLAASSDGRVVWVSSGGMYTRRLEVEDPQWRARPYDGVLAYAETKRAQVVLSALFAERLAERGVVVHAMHPGWADTPAVAASLPRFHTLTRPILRTRREGADTVVWLAAAERARASTGGFWFDRQRRRTHFLPWTRESAADRAMLWETCEAVCARFADPADDDPAPRRTSEALEVRA